MISIEKLYKKISNKYPDLRVIPSDDYLVVSAEDGTESFDGHRLFDYYSDDIMEVNYIFGVHKEFINLIEPEGYFCEWYNAGVIHIYKS